LIGLSLLLGLPATQAWSQPSKRAAERKAEKVNVEELRRALASRQEGRVVGALNRVKSSPDQGKDLAPDVEKLLAKGSTLKVTLNALRALAAVGGPSSSKAIAPYVQHRTPSVRHTAAKALSNTKGPAAVSTLRAALRSPDKEIRNIAASGLGGLKDKAALGDLFEALDHRVYAAAVSIGKLCGPAECVKFMERLRKVQLDVMISGTDEILFRAEVDEKTKLSIVKALAELQTLPATDYLADVYKRWPKDGNKSLKKAIGDAVEDNGGELGEEE
jgi:HEAT repeat protein